MIICICNNKFLAAAAIAIAALLLASCGRADSTPKVDAGQAAASAVQRSVPLLDDAVSSGEGLPTPIERRHFAIYSNYRELFDDPPEAFAPGIGMLEERGLPAVVAAGGPIAGYLPACSMRDLLMQD